VPSSLVLLSSDTQQSDSIPEKHGGELTLKEMPVPQIGEDDILVKILFTGVCHTDVGF
jgi:propanol-preferring alcohol dehydrogenase